MNRNNNLNLIDIKPPSLSHYNKLDTRKHYKDIKIFENYQFF